MATQKLGYQGRTIDIPAPNVEPMTQPDLSDILASALNSLAAQKTMVKIQYFHATKSAKYKTKSGIIKSMTGLIEECARRM